MHCLLIQGYLLSFSLDSGQLFAWGVGSEEIRQELVGVVPDGSQVVGVCQGQGFTIYLTGMPPPLHCVSLSPLVGRSLSTFLSHFIPYR